MADWFKSVFGNQLVVMPDSEITELPSPEELKHKILLKSHKPCGFDWGKIIMSMDDDGTEDYGGIQPIIRGQALYVICQ